MAKREVTKRATMSDSDAEKFLVSYVKHHGWTAAEANRRIRHCAATRWAALDRWVKANQKPVKKVKVAKKVVAKSAPHKKAA
jgi:hypothetical protein